MMAELEVDQSHLPRVEEVRQNFAVLEDGVLAHSLQEQEIEQYYTTNIQKNQLVQNDIRVAKRLQDEEEEQRAQYSALLRQTSRQMEERDFEYARVIQEEIQRRAEEARRREMDDEELAKQIQEEEEERMRRTREASSSGSEEQYSPLSSRGQRSTSDYSSSQFNSPQAGSPRGQRTNARLRSSGGHSFRNPREGLLNEESDESDSVFTELRVRSRTVPSQCKGRDRDYRSVISHTSVSEHNNDYERDHLDGDYNENGYAERRRARNCFIERDYRRESGSWRRNQDVQAELAEVRERRCKRTESVRLPDRRRESFRDGAKTWAYKDNPDKHVRFRDESRKSEKDENGSREVWEMLGQVLRERGVPVRMGNGGAPLQIGAAQRRERRGSHSLYGSEASYSDIQTHHSHFQRASAARHSFHGDIRERRRRSFNREQTQGQRCEPVQPETEIRQREPSLSRDRQGSRRWKERKYVTRDESNAIEHGITRTKSERRPERVHRSTEQERPERRAPNRSQSLRSRHTPLAERDRTSLELGELQQVLHDEELARKLQEEEERVQNRSPGPLARSSCPDGDFTVAQVAQDEEIARYMQKQEIKWKRRSRELEGPVSWREHKAMMSQHDRRARERQVPRERLDSEGLPSPTEEQPHSPVSTLQTASQIRNIAEELDPTFPGRSPGTESLRGDQTGSGCAPLPAPQSGFQDEPTFIPPTKRQAEKSVRPKSKEKRENCKQQ